MLLEMGILQGSTRRTRLTTIFEIGDKKNLVSKYIENPGL